MQDYLGHFDKFLESNCDAMIVYGTDIHNEITILSDFIFKHYHNTGTTFLIRTNHLGNIDFWSTPIELDKRKRRVSGKKYEADGNYFYFDSLSNKPTWNKVHDKIDVAIVYPVDSLQETNVELLMNDLRDIKEVKKIILVSWNDEGNETVNKFLCGQNCLPIAIDKH